MRKEGDEMEKLAVLVVLVLCMSMAGFAGEKNIPKHFAAAQKDFDGFHIESRGTADSEGDFAAAQLFELVRPSGEAVKLGRLYTSCPCVQVTAEKKEFSEGEPVTLKLRNVRYTKGGTYALFVQVLEPVQTTLRYDAYVISEKSIGNCEAKTTGGLWSIARER